MAPKGFFGGFDAQTRYSCTAATDGSAYSQQDQARRRHAQDSLKELEQS